MHNSDTQLHRWGGYHSADAPPEGDLGSRKTERSEVSDLRSLLSVISSSLFTSLLLFLFFFWQKNYISHSSL